MSSASEDILVYLVEDDSAVLKSLGALLNAHGFQTVLCSSAENFLEVFEPSQKACLVLDLQLPRMSGIQLQEHLAEMHVNIPIVVVTAHGDVQVAVRAMRAGAVDFIEKPAEAAQLIAAIQSAGGILFDRRPPNVPKKIVADRLSKLTNREREVLDFLLQGKLNKEIASALSLSPRTVEVHRSRIREKMHARGIADLIRMIG